VVPTQRPASISLIMLSTKVVSSPPEFAHPLLMPCGATKMAVLFASRFRPKYDQTSRCTVWPVATSVAVPPFQWKPKTSRYGWLRSQFAGTSTM
jgi:hypothetical protein